MGSLSKKVERFEKYLDSVIDEDGLVYSEIKADELRPWRNEDFKGFEIWDHFKDDYAGFFNYEDCIMATGPYISAKILKHLNADNGDKKALNDAERCVKALLALSREGDKIEKGYLPKPHGGLKYASKSLNISTDQYEHALFAFWRFRKACSNSPLIPEIESALVSWMDYFIRHDFKYTYYELMEVSLENSVHGLGLFLPGLIMANEITGEEKYVNCLKNKILPVLKDKLIDEHSCQSHPHTINLTSLGLYFSWKKGFFKEECKEALKLLWEEDKKHISSDGLAYPLSEVSDKHQIEPHWLDWVDEPTAKLGYRFLLWRSNMKSAGSCNTAHTGALHERVFPGEGAAEFVRKILNHFEKPGDFVRYYDFDGKQVPGEYSYLKNTISTEFVGAWLEAYYLLEVSKDDGL